MRFCAVRRHLIEPEPASRQLARLAKPDEFSRSEWLAKQMVQAAYRTIEHGDLPVNVHVMPPPDRVRVYMPTDKLGTATFCHLLRARLGAVSNTPGSVLGRQVLPEDGKDQRMQDADQDVVQDALQQQQMPIVECDEQAMPWFGVVGVVDAPRDRLGELVRLAEECALALEPQVLRPEDSPDKGLSICAPRTTHRHCMPVHPPGTLAADVQLFWLRNEAEEQNEIKTEADVVAHAEAILAEREGLDPATKLPTHVSPLTHHIVTQLLGKLGTRQEPTAETPRDDDNENMDEKSDDEDAADRTLASQLAGTLQRAKQQATSHKPRDSDDDGSSKSAQAYADMFASTSDDTLDPALLDADVKEMVDELSSILSGFERLTLGDKQ